MADFPGSFLPSQVAFSTQQTLGAEMQTATAALPSRASAVWPSADLAIFVPIVVNAPVTIVKLACLNGGAVSGTTDVGIYSIDGTRLVSAGSTTQAGTSAWQVFDVTDTQIPAGIFYLGQSVSNTTGTNSCYSAIGTTFLRTMGVLQQTSATPLPATATFAAIASNYCPSLVALTKTTI